MKKSLSWILVLLALVPIISLSYTTVPTLTGKVLAYRGVAFVACLLITLMAWQRPYWWREALSRAWQSSLFRAMTIGAGLLMLSTIVAFDRSVAFFGEPTRGEGFLTLFALFALYVAMTLVFDTKEWKRFFIFTSISSITLFVYELIQLGQGIGRPDSFIGNPIFLAGFYLFSFFGGYYLTVTKDVVRQGKIDIPKRLAPLWGSMAMLASVFGILFTKTRGTLLGVVVAAILCAVLLFIYGKGRSLGRFSMRTIGGAILGFIVLFVAIFWTTRTATFWQSVPGLDRVVTSTAGNTQSRFIYLKITGNGFVESTPVQKVLGWGWDNYAYFWNRNYNPSVHAYDAANADRAHNKLADMLIMTGVVGLISYLALWFFFFRTGLRLLAKNFALGIGVIFLGISYFVHNLFVFDTPVVLFSFYAIVALITQYSNEKQ